MEPGFELASTSLVQEVIDGEAIIMDMGSGCYYSTDGIGAVIWSAALAGAPQQNIIAAAERAFPNIAAGEQVERFLAELVNAGLLRPSDVPGSGSEPNFAHTHRWAAPMLSIHLDMQDLLMLDPIHEVDSTGWPKPKDVPLAPTTSGDA